MDTFFKNPDLMGKLLPALATGLLAFIPAILSWMSNQSAARGRNGRVTQLAAELKLLEQWLSVSRSVRPAADGAPGDPAANAASVQAELDAILAEYRSLRVQAEVRQNQPDELSPWSRRALLFRPLSFGGWMWSIFFWYLLVTLFFVLSSTAADATMEVADRAGTIVVEIVMMGAALYFIRRAALRLRDAQVEARRKAEVVPA
jgi:hypothetical protein